MLAFDEVNILSLLASSEAGWGLARDIPSVEEIERRVGHRTEQRVTVSHYHAVFEPSLRIHFAVVHDHDHREIRRRALVR